MFSMSLLSVIPTQPGWNQSSHFSHPITSLFGLWGFLHTQNLLQFLNGGISSFYIKFRWEVTYTDWVILCSTVEGELVPVLQILIHIHVQHLTPLSNAFHIHIVIVVAGEYLIISNALSLVLSHVQAVKVYVCLLIVPLDLDHWPFWICWISSFGYNFYHFPNQITCWGLSQQ